MSVTGARPRITVAVPYSVHPPQSGGQERVFFLWRGVAASFDVELVTLGEAGGRPIEAEIAAGLREIRVPKTEPYRDAERRLAQGAGNAPVADVAPGAIVGLVPEYAACLARSVAGASLVVVEQPFCLPALRARGAVPLVYDAQNVEARLKAALGAELAAVARAVEGDACAAAALVVACSDDDAAELARLYGIDAGRLHVAPNGIDTAASAQSGSAERAARRRSLGIDGTRVAMFVGSRHPPNVEAAEAILAFASRLPDVTFLIAGSQCLALAGRPRPRNVALMGTVDRATLAAIVAVADVALNPMRSGSGTNVKIAAYLAAGVPTVTTPIGARGYDLVDGSNAVVCPLDDFPGRIRTLLDDAALSDRMAARGRRLAETRYDWQVIADGVAVALERVLAGTATSRARSGAA